MQAWKGKHSKENHTHAKMNKWETRLKSRNLAIYVKEEIYAVLYLSHPWRLFGYCIEINSNFFQQLIVW